jgi:transcriptional regulator
MADRTQAPTWTYASLQVEVELGLYEDPARLRASLDDLVGANEAGRPNAWAIDEMGPATTAWSAASSASRPGC